MNKRTYLFEVVYVSYVINVPLCTINLSASYCTGRESGFCWTIWIRFFYGCGGCAVYFVFKD